MSGGYVEGDEPPRGKVHAGEYVFTKEQTRDEEPCSDPGDDACPCPKCGSVDRWAHFLHDETP